MEEFDINSDIPLIGWTFNTNFANKNKKAINAFLQASYETKKLLSSSTKESKEEWERIKPLMKVKNDEMNLAILGKFLEVLGQIENDEIDQNEGSYAIGMLLKKMYIDSALKKADTINKEYDADEPEEPQKAVADISWSTFKKMNN